MNVLKKNKGFTLVELIVVIAIIGILAAVLVPSLTSYIAKARESSAMQEAKSVYNVYVNYLVEVQAGQTNSENDEFTEYYVLATNYKGIDINEETHPEIWTAYKETTGDLDKPLKEAPYGYINPDDSEVLITPDYFVYQSGSIYVKVTPDGELSITTAPSTDD